MSLLTPLFLLGGLAIALPVMFHLIRRTTRDRTKFSSLMFLQQTPPRLTRKSRLEDLLLLLLRCAALGLLAFGFARPFLKDAAILPPASAEAKRVVLLVDTSASMQRTGLWPAALETVSKQVNAMSPEDWVAVFTFDRQVTPLVGFDEWKATPVAARASLVTEKLSGIKPGWAATQLGTALMRGAEALAESEGKSVPGAGRIVVVSDLQEGSRVEVLQAYEWPKGVEVVLAPLKPKNVGNASLQLVAEATGAGGMAEDTVRVRVANAADSKREQLRVGWAPAAGDGFSGAPVNVYVPPGQSRIVAVPAPPAGTAPDRIRLRGDDEDFDNTVFVTPPEVTRSSVLYFGSEPATDSRQPRYFLERALPGTRRQAIQVVAHPPTAALVPAEVAAAQLMVVTEALPAGAAQELHAQMLDGKTVVLAPKDVTAAASLGPLLGVDRIGVDEGRPNNYAMLAEIDFRHPLFAPFADARFNDFTKLHFWKYRRIDPAAIAEARVVARFDNGDAAVLEVPVGKGRLLILASGWNPDDSQFALSTKFVPWLYALLELSGSVSTAPAQFVVGDAIPASALNGAAGAPVTLTGPDGMPLTLAADATSFSETRLPGIYQITSATPVKRLAVNLDAAEARTVPLSADDLERFGAPAARVPDAVAAAPPERQSATDSVATEGRQKLWRWFIVAALLVLLCESALAGWTARRLAVPAETAA